MAVDPFNITNYNLSLPELEETLLFWVCAAGKNAVSASRGLDQFLNNWGCRKFAPFETIRFVDGYTNLSQELKKCGIGCYTFKARTFSELSRSRLNLKACSVEDLESIYGIGPKTARCFLIHSRPNQNYAGLDTHILAHMRDMGYDVPKSTPSGKKYAELEKLFLSMVKKSGKTVAEYDLEIWKEYRDK